MFIRVFIVLFLVFYCVSIYLFTFSLMDETNALYRASRAADNAPFAAAVSEALAVGDEVPASNQGASSQSAVAGGDDEEAPLVPKKSL